MSIANINILLSRALEMTSNTLDLGEKITLGIYLKEL